MASTDLWTARKWPSLWISPNCTCIQALHLIFGRLHLRYSIYSPFTRLQCPPPPWTAAASPTARRRHDDAASAHDSQLDIDFDIHADSDGANDNEFAQSAARQAKTHRDIM